MTVLEIEECLRNVVKYQSIDAFQDKVSIMFVDADEDRLQGVLTDAVRVTLVFENVMR